MLPSHLRGTTAGRLSRQSVALLIVVALAGAFYCWTAATSAPFDFSSDQTDVYNQLTDGFLEGHTYLPIKPPAGLLALPDPYNPSENQLWRQTAMGDLSLYKGHFYAYWGAVPALTLFLPERLLPVGELPASLAVAIYAILALVFMVLLLRLLVRRFLPDTPSWALVLGAAGLALGTAVPFILRRPAQYEIAITAGACFFAAGLYLLARALLRTTPRLRELAGASLCIGAAFNARPPLLLGGVVLAGLVVLLPRLAPSVGASRLRLGSALLAPFLACVALTGAYNYVRFGSVGNYGVKYQLAGVEPSKQATLSASFIAPGVWGYVLEPPRLALSFPYVFLTALPASYPGELPPDYNLREVTGGLVPMAPIVLFLASLPWMWRRLRKGKQAFVGAIGGLVLLGMAILIGVAFTIYGTTERYEGDFGLLLILAGVLSWLTLLDGVRSQIRRRLLATAGALALAWSMVAGVAISFTGYLNLLQGLHPHTFARLEEITAPLATLPTMVVGHPVIARVDSPAPVTLGNVGYASFGQGGASTLLGTGPVTLIIQSPGSEDVYLRAGLDPGPSAAPGQRPGLSVSSPDRAPVLVPATLGLNYLPVHLHWGLNRVQVNMLETHPAGQAFNIRHMVLVRR